MYVSMHYNYSMYLHSSTMHEEGIKMIQKIEPVSIPEFIILVESITAVHDGLLMLFTYSTNWQLSKNIALEDSNVYGNVMCVTKYRS